MKLFEQIFQEKHPNCGVENNVDVQKQYPFKNKSTNYDSQTPDNTGNTKTACRLKRESGYNNFKKEYNTHTTIRTYTFRESICYILYITGVCDVSPVFDFSEIDIVLLAQTLKHSFEHTKHDSILYHTFISSQI
jgi:hypothetical protein